MNLAKHNLIPEDSDYRKGPLTREQSPSTYSIYKRLANLALAIFACVICINLWLLSADSARNWHDKQANQLGRSLSQQGARTLGSAIAENQQEQLTHLLSSLASDPHVASATLYNKQGILIGSTADNSGLLNLLHNENGIPLVFVEEVFRGEDRVGYLRLLLDEQQVMRYHDEYQQQMYEQLLVMILLAGAVGLLGARAFYKFRFRNYKKISDPSEQQRRREDHAEQTKQRSLGL